MANREVWTVRGVGLEFRKMAKAGAAEAGMPLGKWMELTIAMGAAMTPKGPKEFRESLPKLTAETKFAGPTIREVAEGKAPSSELANPPIVAVVSEYRERDPKAAERWSMNIPPYVPPFEHKTVVELAAELPSTPVEKEEKPKGRKPRSVCQHGIEKGWNCWQCGGLAVIR